MLPSSNTWHWLTSLATPVAEVVSIAIDYILTVENALLVELSVLAMANYSCGLVLSHLAGNLLAKRRVRLCAVLRSQSTPKKLKISHLIVITIAL